jgi:transcriptional regulator with XRE-family HTH domain
MTRVELAARARVGYSTVERLERHGFRPTLSTARKLANALGTTVDILFPESELHE